MLFQKKLIRDDNYSLIPALILVTTFCFLIFKGQGLAPLPWLYSQARSTPGPGLFLF